MESVELCSLPDFRLGHTEPNKMIALQQTSNRTIHWLDNSHDALMHNEGISIYEYSEQPKALKFKHVISLNAHYTSPLILIHLNSFMDFTAIDWRMVRQMVVLSLITRKINLSRLAKRKWKRLFLYLYWMKLIYWWAVRRINYMYGIGSKGELKPIV